MISFDPLQIVGVHAFQPVSMEARYPRAASIQTACFLGPGDFISDDVPFPASDAGDLLRLGELRLAVPAVLGLARSYFLVNSAVRSATVCSMFSFSSSNLACRSATRSISLRLLRMEMIKKITSNRTQPACSKDRQTDA